MQLELSLHLEKQQGRYRAKQSHIVEVYAKANPSIRTVGLVLTVFRMLGLIGFGRPNDLRQKLKYKNQTSSKHEWELTACFYNDFTSEQLTC